MKRKKLDYEKLRRKFPSMNKISSRLASFLEYGEYLTYTNEEIRNMFLSLLKTFNKDCIDLKLRYDLLKLENDKFEDTLIQYENINELDDEEVSSFVRTKDFVDYIGYSQKQKQLIFNLLKKSEQNLNELISEILLSSEVREALKNDIQCFNEKYNFEDDYEKNKQLCLTQKFHVHAREDFLDEDEIALFLKAGLDINTWGVKNRFRYAYFKEKGVNIVIANKNFKKLKM